MAINAEVVVRNKAWPQARGTHWARSVVELEQSAARYVWYFRLDAACVRNKNKDRRRNADRVLIEDLLRYTSTRECGHHRVYLGADS